MANNQYRLFQSSRILTKGFLAAFVLGLFVLNASAMADIVERYNAGGTLTASGSDVAAVQNAAGLAENDVIIISGTATHNTGIPQTIQNFTIRSSQAGVKQTIKAGNTRLYNFNDGVKTYNINLKDLDYQGYSSAVGNAIGLFMHTSPNLTLNINTDNVSFTGFKASTHHGGVFGLDSGGNLNITATNGLVFDGNRTNATTGGAIHVNTGTLSIKADTLTFKNSYAKTTGGAIHTANKITIEADALTFEDNSSGSHGGAIHGAAGVNLNITGGAITFARNSNGSGDGGAIRMADGGVNISGKNSNSAISFSNNVSKGLGGAISARANISNGTYTFENNSAGTYGGAIHGGIVTFSGDGSSAVFTGNKAASGGNDLNISGSSGTVLSFTDNGTYSFDGGIRIANAGVQTLIDKAQVTIAGRAGDSTNNYNLENMYITNSGKLTAKLDNINTFTGSFNLGAGSTGTLELNVGAGFSKQISLSDVAVSGDGVFAKTGAGSLTLAGSNSYVGETKVSGGTLLVPSSTSLTTARATIETGGTFRVGSDMFGTDVYIEGGTFVIGDTIASSILNVNALSLNGGSINFNFNDSANNDADWLKVATATLNSGYIDLSFTSDTASTWWDYIHDNFSDGFSIINGFISNYDQFSSDNVKVSVNGMPTNSWKLEAQSDQVLLLAVGDGVDPEPAGSLWYDANTSDIGLTNWTITGTDKLGAKFTEGGNSATFTGNVAMENSGTFNVSEDRNLTLSGIVSGSGSVTKIGDGTLTLSATNTYTGDTNVSAGTMELTSTATLASSTINVSDGATLLYNNTVPHNTSPLTINVNGGTLEFYNTTAAETHTINNGICSGIAGQDVTINGTGATLLIDGGGTIAAMAGTGASTITFALDSNSVIDVKNGYFINGGYAKQNWDNNQATLHIGATGKVELWDGAQMKVGGLTGEVGAQLVETKGGNGISIGNGTTSDQTFVYNGSISLNAKALTKVGDGTQVLNGNIVNAKTTVNSGTLVLGTAGNEINIGTNSLIKTNGGAVRVDGNIIVNSSYLSAGGTWTGDGSITVNNGGVLRAYGAFAYAKGITLNGGMLFNDGDSDGSATAQSTFSSPITITESGGSVQAGWSSSKSGQLTLSGGLYGSGNLTVNSDSNMGWIYITGEGNYTGTLILKGKIVTGPTNKGSADNPASTTPYLGSGEIQLAGGLMLNNSSYWDVPNKINVVSNSSIRAGYSRPFIFSGPIIGSGNLTVENDNSWIVLKTQSPDNSFTGAFQINYSSSSSQGRVRFEAEQPLGANVGQGNIYGTLDMNGFSQKFNGLYNNGNKGTIYNNASNLSTLTIDTTSKDLTFQSAINGNIELVIDGNGKQTFTNNASSFTGNVVINGGTVTLSSGNSGGNSTLGKVQADRTIHVNQGAELNLKAQDVFTNAHAQNPLMFVVDGGKISNTDAYYNYLTNLTLKNGAELYASEGNATWKAYKLHNLKVERNSDGSAGVSVSITADSSKPNATIGFGDISDVIRDGNSVSTINVEEITSANAATSDSVSDLVISAVITDPTYQTNGGLKNATKIIKTGAGTMELTAANTYTGGTTVSQGALTLASTGSIVSDVTVESGASFIDTARQITSNVTLNGGSFIVGDTIATAEIEIGDLIVNDGSIWFDFNSSSVNDDYDYLTTGAATINSGSINITFNNGDQTEWWNNNTDDGYVLIDTTSLSADLNNIQLLVNSTPTLAWYLDKRDNFIVLKNQNIEPPVTDLYYRANLADDIAAEKWTIDGSNKKGVTFTEGAASATYAGGVEMNAAGTFEVSENKNLTLAGVVSGSGEIEKLGDGTLTLSGDNTNTGKTTVSEGTLALTGAAVKANNSIEVAQDATLEYNVAAGEKQLTFSDDVTVSGAGDVVKTGSGKLKILAADGQFESNTFAVNAGELDFKGQYNGDLTVKSGATLSPGNSVGDLTVYGDVKIDASGTLLFEFSPYNEDPAMQEFDTLAITDASNELVLDTNSIVKLFFTSAADANLWAAEGAEYKLVSDEGFVAGVTDMSDLLGNYNALFSLEGRTDGLYLIGLGAGPAPEPGSGVPEPSTWALLVLGVVALFLRKRVRS